MMSTPLQLQTPSKHEDALMTSRSRLPHVRRPHTPNATHNTGRWETWERLRFLQGLRIYGKGKWKQISEMISTR